MLALAPGTAAAINAGRLAGGTLCGAWPHHGIAGCSGDQATNPSATYPPPANRSHTGVSATRPSIGCPHTRHTTVTGPPLDSTAVCRCPVDGPVRTLNVAPPATRTPARTAPCRPAPHPRTTGRPASQTTNASDTYQPRLSTSHQAEVDTVPDNCCPHAWHTTPTRAPFPNTPCTAYHVDGPERSLSVSPRVRTVTVPTTARDPAASNAGAATPMPDSNSSTIVTAKPNRSHHRDQRRHRRAVRCGRSFSVGSRTPAPSSNTCSRVSLAGARRPVVHLYERLEHRLAGSAARGS